MHQRPATQEPSIQRMDAGFSSPQPFTIPDSNVEMTLTHEDSIPDPTIPNSAQKSQFNLQEGSTQELISKCDAVTPEPQVP